MVKGKVTILANSLGKDIDNTLLQSFMPLAGLIA